MVRPVNEQERQTALHEAGHACAAIVLGLDVSLVSRWSPHPHLWLGETRLPDLFDDLDRDKARDIAKMILCGPIMADQEVPTWPLSKSNTGDETQLAILAEYMRLDESGWLGVRAAAFELTTTDEYCRLFEGVTGLLEHFPRLDTAMLK